MDKEDKQLLIINTDYTLTDEQEVFLKRLKDINSPKITVKRIFKRNLSTKQFRKKFESKIKGYSKILLFDIFHVTIDINYLRDLIILNKEFCIIHNKFFDIVDFSDKDKIEKKFGTNIYDIYDLDTSINSFLKKSVQKIGRDNKKSNLKEKNKNFKFGRPKGTKQKTQYDRDKELIRYRLEKEMKIIDIHKELGYGSITALRYFIKSRFRKKYII